MKLFINGEEREVAPGLTLAALLEQLGMKADRVAVELNREIAARERWSATTLAEGDQLEIVHFVGGGAGELPKRGRRSPQPSALSRLILKVCPGWGSTDRSGRAVSNPPL